MIKKYTCYETTDGQTFKALADAEQAEDVLRAKDAITAKFGLRTDELLGFLEKHADIMLVLISSFKQGD